MNQVDPLFSLKKQLEKTILKLESNEILQQMRNDESLAEFKRQHIREIIQQELQLQPLIQKLNEQNNQLKGLVYQKENILRQKTDEFVMELQNIEIKWAQFRVQKDKERKQVQQRYLRQLQSVKSQVVRVNKEYQNMNTLSNRMKKQIQSLKEDRLKLEQNKASMEEQIRQLSNQLKQKTVKIQKKEKQIEEKRLISSSEYEQTIQKMKQDMIYIKQCWQRQCLNIQNQLREENQFLALQYEQKMRRELKQHAENLKMGNNVVINDSEQIITKRVQKIQQEYSEQMRKFEEEMHELSKLYQLTKQQIEKKEQINKQLRGKTHEYEIELEKLKRDSEFKMKNNNIQLENLREQLQRYELDTKKLKKSVTDLKRQNDQIKEDNLGLIKKQSTISTQKQEIRKELQSNANKLNQLQSSVQDLNKQLLTTKQQIAIKDQNITLKDTEIKSIKNQLLKSQQLAQQQKMVQSKMNQSIKKHKEMIKRLVSIIDKLHLTIRKSRNQVQMIRQEVKCSFQILKNKCLVQVDQIVDKFAFNREQIQRKHKQKLSQLLDQMETKQKELIQEISQEKQQLKNQNQQNQTNLQKIQNQIQKYKVRLQESERERNEIIEDLQKQKLVVSKLEKKLDENQLIFYNSLNRVQKDIGRTLAHFHSKWSQNIKQLQQELVSKQAKIKSCFDKIDQLVGQVQDKNNQIQFADSQIKKYKKKYQQIHSERNEKIENLMKQLQKETKHKINLQKQLKQVRMSIMGGNSKVINFSFNDKERDSNIMASYKKTDSSMKQQYSMDRDKEISQLKEMIAKTYKVFGEGSVPERDLSKNLSKRNIL